ncbi:mRNA cap guanine-N7 methyltransferase-like [Oscarella lobularis]|uniref:mRNA cap guanine-N7 methyltransferase-like n=1 Tax=Oscarella lobularis TaxID=121494 RepID=UPI00331436C9
MDPLPHGKLYHSFVVHSSADTDYVKRKLIPQLEDDRGLKLCFSWRDYEAKGDKDAALSNLNRCLAESCVVALLVTNNYAASASSQDATRIALELMGREAIIRIVLEKGVNTPNLSGQGLVKIELFNPEVKANFFENLSKLIKKKIKDLYRPIVQPDDVNPVVLSDNDKEPGTSSSAVATWYNKLPERGIDFRRKSPIFYLRNFNNWVKSVLINAVLNRLPSNPYVLDLCCGKGGDLLKWRKGRVGYLAMADIAKTSVEQAEARMESKGVRIPSQFIVADCSRTRLADLYEDATVREQGFHLSSCQFSFHYGFESEEQALMMIRNACERVRPGGYFIGTIPNAQEIVYRLRKSKDLKFGNDLYHISADSELNLDEVPLFGAKYHFHLEEVVDVPEYLIYFPLLEKILKEEYGMNCVLETPFHDFFETHMKSNLRLLHSMEALETRDEGRNTFGTISEDQWEAIGLYIVFAFHKPLEVREKTID